MSKSAETLIANSQQVPPLAKVVLKAHALGRAGVAPLAKPLEAPLLENSDETAALELPCLDNNTVTANVS